MGKEVRFFFQTLIIFSILFNCALLQKSVKIKPLSFEYEIISANYFSPKNDRPFPLTVQRGNNLYNSVSLDGKYLFFSSDNAGNFDIWMRDLNSSVVLALTDHPSGEYKPSVSPDGKHLVYVSEEFDSRGDLILMNINPSEWIKLVLKGESDFEKERMNLTNPKGRDVFLDSDPAWSPDNKKIVFSTDRFSPGLPNLAILELKSKKMTPITTKGGASPSWSLDGRFISYISYKDHPLGEVYVFDIATGSENRITDDVFMDFSPSLSLDSSEVFYTSIRKDSNKNGSLDTRDNSFIIKKSLTNGEERSLTSGTTPVFDTRFSPFNRGSIIYSAAFYNSINVYFIPASGPIPKKNTIDEQYEFAMRYREEEFDSFLLALDSVKAFFRGDGLYPLYKARIDLVKGLDGFKKKGKEYAESILSAMKLEASDPLFSASGVLSLILENSLGQKKSPQVFEDYARAIPKKPELSNQIAFSLKIAGDENMRSGNEIKSKQLYNEIITTYPSFYQIREVKRKFGKLEFVKDKSRLPKEFFEILNDPGSTSEDIRFVLSDLEKLLTDKMNNDERIIFTDKILASEDLKAKCRRAYDMVNYIKANALSSKRKFKESNDLIETFLAPKPPDNPDCIVNPLCIKPPVCYKDPVCLKSRLLKSKNFENLGSVYNSFDELRIYLENYDPSLGVEVDDGQMEKSFRWFENKARDHELKGNLKEAAFHYFFNTENMYLVKSKELFLDTLYREYAVYYQRKMVDGILHYAEVQAEEERNSITSKATRVVKVVSYLSSLYDTPVVGSSIRAMTRIFGDFRDLEPHSILGKSGNENALKLLEQHFALARPRAKSALYLASLYGYAYYHINRAVITENYHFKNASMTQARKEKILEDFKIAEYELKWVIFADPLYYDAYQLLGWLYQYIDNYKNIKKEGDELTQGEIYESEYNKFFPSKHFEENIELYKQILGFLGEAKNKKVLSDLNLNIANNYLLLNNYTKAAEHFKKVEDYEKFIVRGVRFEDYRQEAVYYYNYARSLLYQGEFKLASVNLEKAITSYEKNEYYKKNKESSSKLTLLYALLGFTRLEGGDYSGSIRSYKKAIALDRESEYIDKINLYNAIAICYQKLGKFHFSDYFLHLAEVEYKKTKKTFSDFIPEFPELISLDIVVGKSSLPPLFKKEHQRLLTYGIKIENRDEEWDFDRATQIEAERNKFLKSSRLSSAKISEEILSNAEFRKGIRNYKISKYSEAREIFSKIKKNAKKTGLSHGLALKYEAYSVFRMVEDGDTGEKGLNSLKENLEFLEEEKEKSISACELDNKKRPECEEIYYRGSSYVAPLIALHYYYIAEIFKLKGYPANSAHYFGLAHTILKDPWGISEIQDTPKDVFNRLERLRINFNLCRVYFKLGDEANFNSCIEQVTGKSEEYGEEEVLFRSLVFRGKVESYKKDFVKAEISFNTSEKLLDNYISLFWKVDEVSLGKFFQLEKKTALELGRGDIERFDERFISIQFFRQILESKIQFEESDFKNDFEKISKSLTKDLELSDERKKLFLQKVNLKSFDQKRKKLKSEYDLYVSQFVQKYPLKSHILGFETKFSGKKLNNGEGVIKVLKDKEIFYIKKITKNYNNYTIHKLNKNSKLLDAISREKNFLNGLKEITLIPDFNFSEKEIREASDFIKKGYSSNLRVSFRYSDLYEGRKITTNIQSLYDSEKENLQIDRIKDSDLLISKPLRVSKLLGEDSEFAKQIISKTNHLSISCLQDNDEINFKRISSGFDALRFSGVSFVGFWDVCPKIGENPSIYASEYSYTSGKLENKKEKQDYYFQAINFERSGDLKSALENYLNYIYTEKPDRSSKFLEARLASAEIKTKIYPTAKKFIFFENLLKEYASDPDFLYKISTRFLLLCNLNFSEKDCVSFVSNYNYDSKQKDFNFQIKFYSNLISGNLLNFKSDYKTFLEKFPERDEFLSNIELAQLFTRYYLPEQAEFHAWRSLSSAVFEKEKEIARSRIGSLEFKKFFLGGKFDPQNLSIPGIYGNLVHNEQDKYFVNIDEIFPGELEESVSVYKKRIHSLWKDFISGRYAEPLFIYPEKDFRGKSIFNQLEDQDKDFIFHIISKLIMTQSTENEVSVLADSILSLDIPRIRKPYFYLQIAESLFNRGDYFLSKKYIAQIFEKNSYYPGIDQNFDQRFELLKYKLHLFSPDGVIRFDPGFLSSKVGLYPVYDEARILEVSEMPAFINNYILNKKGEEFTERENQEFVSLLTLLQRISFQKNDSSFFLDLSFYKDKIRSYQPKYFGKNLTYSDLPVFKPVLPALLKSIPKNQVMVSVVDFGLETYSIRLEGGKSYGILAYKDNRILYREILNYYLRLEEKGSAILIKESMESKFRDAIGLKKLKGKLVYLYLGKGLFRFPFEQKEEDNIYLTLAPELLISNIPVKQNNYFINAISPRFFRNTKLSDPGEERLNRYREYLITEKISDDGIVNISLENIARFGDDTIRFGSELPSAKRNIRQGVWLLGASSLNEIHPEFEIFSDLIRYLDKFQHGPGVFTVLPQDNIESIFILSNFLSREKDVSLKARFIETIQETRAILPERYWSGYRLYTNSYIAE